MFSPKFSYVALLTMIAAGGAMGRWGLIPFLLVIVAGAGVDAVGGALTARRRRYGADTRRQG